MKRGRRVEVRWSDAAHANGTWRKIKELRRSRRKNEPIVSAGIVLSDDKRGMMLASSAHDGSASGVIIIPRGVIRKVRRLR
ncbi:MAG TPA: hypothetical protein VIO16_03420 [Dehalococcoidia bacterium]|jgi:hypothetical protein